MASRDKERYFWLKLHRDFFKRHDIRVLERMPDGKALVLFYLKLMTESVDHGGALRFSEAIPYSEEMLSCVTDTEPELVRTGIQALRELGMLELREDGTITLPAVEKLLGSETYAAGRQRELRQSRAAGDGVACRSPGCRPEKETESESEPEPDPEKETEPEEDTEVFAVPAGTACRPEDVRRVVQAWNSLGLQQLSAVTAKSRRGGMLRARIAEYGTEAVLEAIEKIRGSAFLRGQNARGWTVTFEWFVRPNNFPKVLEGNYDAAPGPAAAETTNPFLAMLLEAEHDQG